MRLCRTAPMVASVDSEPCGPAVVIAAGVRVAAGITARPVVRCIGGIGEGIPRPRCGGGLGSGGGECSLCLRPQVVQLPLGRAQLLRAIGGAGTNSAQRTTS